MGQLVINKMKLRSAVVASVSRRIVAPILGKQVGKRRFHTSALFSVVKGSFLQDVNTSGLSSTRNQAGHRSDPDHKDQEVRVQGCQLVRALLDLCVLGPLTKGGTMKRHHH